LLPNIPEWQCGFFITDPKKGKKEDDVGDSGMRGVRRGSGRRGEKDGKSSYLHRVNPEPGTDCMIHSQLGGRNFGKWGKECIRQIIEKDFERVVPLHGVKKK